MSTSLPASNCFLCVSKRGKLSPRILFFDSVQVYINHFQLSSIGRFLHSVFCFIYLYVIILKFHHYKYSLRAKSQRYDEQRKSSDLKDHETDFTANDIFFMVNGKMPFFDG